MVPKSTVKRTEGGKTGKIEGNGQKRRIPGILMLLFPFILQNAPGLILFLNYVTTN